LRNWTAEATVIEHTERDTVIEILQALNIYQVSVYVEQPFLNGGCLGIGAVGGGLV
jgi:hypothetical protein